MRIIYLSLFLSFCILISSGCSTAESWYTIQSTGGIKVSDPIQKDGKRLLPVDYDISGTRTITRKPTTVNSGIIVSEITAKRKENQIILKVYSCPAGKEKRNKSFADISSFPSGKYEVYYLVAGNKDTFLGEITIE